MEKLMQFTPISLKIQSLMFYKEQVIVNVENWCWWLKELHL